MRKILFITLSVALFACNDGPGKTDVVTPTPEAPKAINYSIIKTYPHDTSFFIQGLVIYKGELYEGTGLNGKSKLMKMDLATGKPLKKIDLDEKYFGEGVTILRDTIYQLTWQQNVVFAYTLADFKKVKEFKINTEGWGLTNNGSELIVSDGTSTIYYYNPTDFSLLRTQTITESGTLSYNLNELEYIDGYIYANQLNAPYILKIDPGSGAIVGKADLTPVWKRIQTIDPLAEVPNGIAYDSASKKIYITGKLWPELYEIEFSH